MWGLTRDNFVCYGSEPFAVSEGGRTIIARTDQGADSLSIRRLGDAPGICKTVRFDAPSSTILDEIRCDDSVILLQFASVGGRWFERVLSWRRIDIESGVWKQVDRATWEAAPAPRMIPQQRRDAAGGTELEYRSTSGLCLAVIKPALTPGRVVRRNADGTETLLLRESPGPFFGRLVASAGVQYP